MRFLSFAIFADVPEWRNCQVYVRQFRLATNPARPTGSRGLFFRAGSNTAATIRVS